MFSISATTPLKPSTGLAVIIPFKSHSHKKAQLQPCIFCGKTLRIQKFKGKTVCIQCLLLIPDIFSCR